MIVTHKKIKLLRKCQTCHKEDRMQNGLFCKKCHEIKKDRNARLEAEIAEMEARQAKKNPDWEAQIAKIEAGLAKNLVR